MAFREAERRRQPRLVGELIEGLSRQAGWAERLAVGTLRRRWAEVVGGAIAGVSEPVRLDSGVLTVRAEAGAWATELTLLAGTLAERAAGLLGPGSVREVKVIAGRGSGRRGPA